jgi:chemotaxis protein MotA
MPIKAFRFAASLRAETGTGLDGDLAAYFDFDAAGTFTRTASRMKLRIHIDKSTLTGTFIALAGIAAGLLIEGGRLSQVLQPTAALIVFGGTLGAVMVQFPLSVVLRAFIDLKNVFFGSEAEPDALIQNLLRYAYKARKEGLLSLDGELSKIQDPFLKESLMLAIDGTNVDDLRRMMELQLDFRAEKDERVPKVFEAAAGFSPTIGILGAVLGLIQVMQHLQDINEVGKGIAVAFVATIYGVGAANLLFLPWAGKLKLRIRERQVVQEMTLEAVLSIMIGMNPRALELQLFSYLPSAGIKPGLAKVGAPKVVQAKTPAKQSKVSVAKSR